MDPREMVLFTSVFHLPAAIAVTSVHPSASELVIGVACQAAHMPCPECQQLSARIHGRYQRTVADLPCAGRTVILALTVRKFVCSTPTCSRKIFTERLPGLMQSYARMTPRLAALVRVIGLGTGWQLGTRLAERHGIATTPSSLLRSLMQFRASSVPAVRVLGVDDWSWKKGRSYGTILVDLQRHTIIDLLQDRERSTFARGCVSIPPSGSSVVTEPPITLPPHEKPLPRRFKWQIATIWCITWSTLSNCSWLAVVPRFAERARNACQKTNHFHRSLLCPCRLHKSGGNSQLREQNVRITLIGPNERTAIDRSQRCTRKG